MALKLNNNPTVEEALRRLGASEIVIKECESDARKLLVRFKRQREEIEAMRAALLTLNPNGEENP